jgi:hypothetical protein
MKPGKEFVNPFYYFKEAKCYNEIEGFSINASTAVFQPLTQVSNAAATTGLTSGFGMGPGRTLLLWPA